MSYQANGKGIEGYWCPRALLSKAFGHKTLVGLLRKNSSPASTLTTASSPEVTAWMLCFLEAEYFYKSIAEEDVINVKRDVYLSVLSHGSGWTYYSSGWRREESLQRHTPSRGHQPHDGWRPFNRKIAAASMRAQYGESGWPTTKQRTLCQRVSCASKEQQMFRSPNLIPLDAYFFLGTFGHQHLWAWLEWGWADSGCDNGQGTCTAARAIARICMYYTVCISG